MRRFPSSEPGRPPGRAGRARWSPTLASLIAAAALLLAACGQAASPAPPVSPSLSGAPSPVTTPVPPTPTPAPLPSATATPAPTAAPGDPAGVVLALEPFVAGLDAPLLVTNAGDGSDRVFIVEQGGRIRVVDGGQLVDQPYLDISDRVTAGGEQGLLGLAFHPQFGETDRRLFVNYTDRDGNTVVSSFTVPGPHANRADPASEQVLLTIEQPFANHNGGALAFGPDGMLYVAVGDGGSGGDPLDAGQRLDTLLGKILRIDVDHAGGELAYAVPPDNPFVGRAEARPEIWAFGLRNPWRISFDRVTGDLWIGDVGQGSWEEVNRLAHGVAGANLGWNRMEGAHCYLRPDCDPADYLVPLAEYSHAEGCSVTGGFVYRGNGQPALAGVYLFADYCSGRVWGIPSSAAGPVTPTVLLESGHNIASFGEDEDGELYVADIAEGSVLRITGAAR